VVGIVVGNRVVVASLVQEKLVYLESKVVVVLVVQQRMEEVVDTTVSCLLGCHWHLMDHVDLTWKMSSFCFLFLY
jgi:hypothetical protein